MTSAEVQGILDFHCVNNTITLLCCPERNCAQYLFDTIHTRSYLWYRTYGKSKVKEWTVWCNSLVSALTCTIVAFTQRVTSTVMTTTYVSARVSFDEDVGIEDICRLRRQQQWQWYNQKPFDVLEVKCARDPHNSNLHFPLLQFTITIIGSSRVDQN